MRVPFERVHHLVTVPVTAGDVAARFVLDTGIGLTLFSSSLCERLGVEPTRDVFRGRRMSGQEIAVELVRVDSLRLGSFEQRNFVVGVLDLDGLPPELAGGGFLSLAFLAGQPFTVDYPTGGVVLETAETLAARLAGGVAVAVSVERSGPSVDVFLPLSIPGGRSISVEVDMGSGALILDERFAAEVGVDLSAPEVRRVEGTDETGGSFTRYFAQLPGNIHPTGAPELVQEQPEAMFQRIVRDGLLGDSFLRRRPVTYDLPNARIVFGPAARAG